MENSPRFLIARASAAGDRIDVEWHQLGSPADANEARLAVERFCEGWLRSSEIVPPDRQAHSVEVQVTRRLAPGQLHEPSAAERNLGASVTGLDPASAGADFVVGQAQFELAGPVRHESVRSAGELVEALLREAQQRRPRP
ncbi:MAG: hypothetical protein R2761_06720 [Acidimicrobiales bacterium]